MMLKSLLFFSLSVLSLLEIEHDPNLATVTIKQEKGVWIFTMSCAQAGLHEAIASNHPELKNTPITETAYKEAVVEYVKKTVEFTANDFGEVTFGQGGVRLGPHQSDVKFELLNMPDDIKRFKIVIRTMGENAQHVNLVKVFLASKPERLLLDRSNNYTSTVVN